MSTTASGSVKPGGSGEGRWWMTGCNGFITLTDLAIGDTFVMWGEWAYNSAASGSGAFATVVGAGSGARYMRVTAPGTMSVHTDSCHPTGLLIHEVLSEFDEPNWSCG
ncbi:MAG: hypothetical protein ACOYB2_10645 [Limnohabitans sp.]